MRQSMDRYDAKLQKSPRAVFVSAAAATRPDLSGFKPYSAGPGYRFFTDGTLQRRCETPTRSRARVYDLGAGQIEAIITPVKDWEEVTPLSPQALADAIEQQHVSRVLTPLEQEERDDNNMERSCRRARTKVRRLAKFKRLDTMLTLTYAANQQDRQLAQRHLASFVRRVRRVIPGFEYVAVAEPQKRGAWHWHMAVRQVLSGYWVGGRYVHSWKLLRSIWRDVIDGGGNIDVNPPGKPGQGVHKLASYLTKYITKGFASGVKNQNRYQASGRDLPDGVTIELPTLGQAAVADVHMLLMPEWAGGRVYTSPPLASGGYFLAFTPDS